MIQMKYLISCFSIVFLSGCSFNLKEVHPLEYAWQGLHVVDGFQTIHGVASRPHCREEVHPLTKRLIGSHPNKDAVATWWAGSAIVHFLLGKWVDKTFKKGDWNIFIRAVDVGDKFRIVHGNHKTGLRYNGVTREEDTRCNEMLEQQSVNLKWKF